MRLCPTDDLREGMVVGRPVYDDRLDLLLSAGQELTQTMINRLRQLEIFDIYIQEPGTEDIKPPIFISQKTRRRAQRLLRSTFDRLMNIAEFSEAAKEDIVNLIEKNQRYRNAIRTDALRDITKRALEELMKNNTENYEVSFMNSYLNYHYEHALNTMILSLVIGRGFHYSEDELLQLGLAALLHDVGKIAWPKLARKRRSNLNRDEIETLKKHPVVGAKIINAIIPNSGVEQASVRCHHERQDGMGYPFGLVGSNREPIRQHIPRSNEIFRMAEIIAVANAFDNFQKGEYSAESMTPIEAAEALVHHAGAVFNKTVVDKAVSLINLYPVGALVVLKSGNSHVPSGMRGVVRRAPLDDLKRPEIVILWDWCGHRVAPISIDLDTMPEIQIELV